MSTTRFNKKFLRSKSTSISRQKIFTKTVLAAFTFLCVWVYYDSYTGIINGVFQKLENNNLSDVKDHDYNSKQMSKHTTLKEVQAASESNYKVVEVIKDDLLQDVKFRPSDEFGNPDKLWLKLINEIATKKNPGIVVEVGMHNLQQCLQAASAGLHAHCVEPSPTNFERITHRLKDVDTTVRDRIHLYNVAAGDTSEGTVPFLSQGSTGDHIGNANMWLMDTGLKVTEGKTIDVPSKKLDDIIADLSPDIVIELLKVDTQGYEPSVLAGLTKTLSQQRINYILLEFWPRGMDLLADKKDACIGADLLHDLAKNGYTLYTLKVEAHPNAPNGHEEKINTRPMDNFEGYCRWYFSLETMFPKKEYKMGYWSNILAVAPSIMKNAPIGPVSRKLLGK